MTTSLRLLNVIYTNDMVASAAFSEWLGLQRRDGGDVNEGWNEYPIGDATLALHWHQDEPLPMQSNTGLHVQAGTADFNGIYGDIAVLKPLPLGTLEGVGRYFTMVEHAGVRVQANERSS